MRVSAVIVAAGQGKRLQTSVPKQFYLIDGKPILFYTLSKFEACSRIDEIILVVAEDWLFHVSKEVVDKFEFHKIRKIVSGGQERQDSVFAGLKALDYKPDMVVIHDAVRPLVSIAKIKETIEACQAHGAAILAIPPADTVKVEKKGFVDRTLDRSKLWLVQTPQTFNYDLIMRAHKEAQKQKYYATDDSALVERLGHKVKIVPGEEINIKITRPMDLKLAEILLREKT